MKIAYLIMAHSNFNHLKRLVSALDDNNVEFFIHIDDKTTLPDNLNDFENIVFVRGPKVWWAGWSQVDAIIRLIRTCITQNFDYYVLLSGTDYPIRSNSFLYHTLSLGGEYINIVEGFTDNKPEDRIKFFYFDCFDRRNQRNIKTIFFFLLERISRPVFQKKSYPFIKIYHGSTWWALSHDCLSYVLEQIDSNKDLINFYRTSLCPDESFFQTIIGNSPFFIKCKTNLTFTDWSSNPAPALINQNHIELFKKQTEFKGPYGTYIPFFARKFDDTSTNTLELIEKELRN
jgi:hypothetical protein